MGSAVARPAAAESAPAPVVVWAPWKPQRDFLTCPYWEILQEGERGGGKTEAALIGFAQHVGKGWGSNWRGVYLRRTYRELKDVIKKSERFFGPRGMVTAWKSAKFNKSPGGAQGYTWEFETGEWLMFAAAKSEEDIAEFLGWELPWINFGELTAWPTPAVYDGMKGTSRSSHPDVAAAKKYCSETNPWGPGAQWVKDRFVTPAPALTPIPTLEYEDADGKTQTLYRVRIPSLLEDNIALQNDPAYRAQLESITDPDKRRAWIGGDDRWNITVGGIVGDVWNEGAHLVPPFNVPWTWKLDRSFDWGSSHPFSIGWWAESDGTGTVDGNGTQPPKGSLILLSQWYGWNGTANQGLRLPAAAIAQGIKEREQQLLQGLCAGHKRVADGPAGTDIWTKNPGDQSIAERMAHEGIKWKRADTSPGSRVNGWEAIRAMLSAAADRDPEHPWLLVCDTPQTRDGFIRTVPVLPRAERNPDDAAGAAAGEQGIEDHDGDMARYRALANIGRLQIGWK